VPREELLERVSNVGAVMQYELEVLCAEYPGLIANARSNCQLTKIKINFFSFTLDDES
jgi:hypothetical protein